MDLATSSVDPSGENEVGKLFSQLRQGVMRFEAPVWMSTSQIAVLRSTTVTPPRSFGRVLRRWRAKATVRLSGAKTGMPAPVVPGIARSPAPSAETTNTCESSTTKPFVPATLPPVPAKASIDPSADQLGASSGAGTGRFFLPPSTRRIGAAPSGPTVFSMNVSVKPWYSVSARRGPSGGAAPAGPAGDREHGDREEKPATSHVSSGSRASSLISVSSSSAAGSEPATTPTPA